MSTSNQVIQVGSASAAAAAVAATTPEDVIKQNEDLARQIEQAERENDRLRKVLERMKVQQDLKEKLDELLREKEELYQQIEAVQLGKPSPTIAELELSAEKDARARALAHARDAASSADWARRCYDKARLDEC
jgi:hypothetical protein